MTDWYIEQTIIPTETFGYLVANRMEDEWQDYTDVRCALMDVKELLSKNPLWEEVKNDFPNPESLSYYYMDTVLGKKIRITYTMKKRNE